MSESSVQAPPSAVTPEPATAEPPAWLSGVAFTAAGAVLSVGVVGLFLADRGWYSLARMVPIAVVAAAGLGWLAWPLRPRGKSTRAAHAYAALGLLAIVGVTGWNVAHSSQHMMLDRDGGAYISEGKWIAEHGSLDVHPRVEPFASETSLGYDSQAVYKRSNGTLQFQFAHLTPALLAPVANVFGDEAMLRFPAVLTGIALLAFFVLAWRLVRHGCFALTAMLALAFTMPEVWFGRDAYSEIPSQLLMFTALWVVASRRVLPGWRAALIAGLFLGATEAARIDALVGLIGVPVVLGVAWLMAAPPDRRAMRWSIVAFVGGLVPGLVLGWTDLTQHSGRYFSDLSHDVYKLVAAVAASAIGMGVLVLVWRFLVPVVRRLPMRAIAIVAGSGVVVLGFGVWALRPRAQHMRSYANGLTGLLQSQEHAPVDLTRTFAERSMTWMAWYLGPLTVAVAIVGSGALVYALLRGERRRTIAPLAILVPGSLLYLYKTSIAPDQIWVTRRFLVSAFPTIVLIAFGFAAWVARRQLNGSLRIVPRVGAIAFAVIAVAYPIVVVVPVQAMTEQKGYLDLIESVCDRAGPHGAIVLLNSGSNDQLAAWIPQPLRSFCGADVAIQHGHPNPETLQRLAQAAQAQGRKLVVVATEPETITNLFPDPGAGPEIRAVNDDWLERTITRRPDAYQRETFSVYVADVPTG